MKTVLNDLNDSHSLKLFVPQGIAKGKFSDGPN